MLVSSLLAACGLVSLVAAGPCPFHQLRDAAAAGLLSPREEAIVDRMAHDPAYIPALDPEAAALMKRGANPEPKAKAPSVKSKSTIVEKRQLPIIGGGLCTLCAMSLSVDIVCSLVVFSFSERSASATFRCPCWGRCPHPSRVWSARDSRRRRFW